MAAVDYFLKIDGIQGESKAAKHKGEIDLLSFSWAETQSGTFGTSGGGGTGKVSMQDFQFTMRVNKASPALFLACAQGDHIKSAILTCQKAGKQQEFLKITMSDCLVSSFQIGGDVSGDGFPTDQVSLNFAKIEVDYKEQDAAGKVLGSIKKWFDLRTLKGGG
jgi:type VI secretion system secreted protein Hcp